MCGFATPAKSVPSDTSERFSEWVPVKLSSNGSIRVQLDGVATPVEAKRDSESKIHWRKLEKAFDPFTW